LSVSDELFEGGAPPGLAGDGDALDIESYVKVSVT
jgi:hypothetical protein